MIQQIVLYHHKAQELYTNCGRLTFLPVPNLGFWFSIVEVLPLWDVAHCWLVIYSCHPQPPPLAPPHNIPEQQRPALAACAIITGSHLEVL